MFGETGLLGDDGPAGGQVAGAPVAEPAGVQPDVLILGDGEFAFRSPDVIAIEPVIDAQIVRASGNASRCARNFARVVVVLDVGRELEGFARISSARRRSGETRAICSRDIFRRATRCLSIRWWTSWRRR